MVARRALYALVALGALLAGAAVAAAVLLVLPIAGESGATTMFEGDQLVLRRNFRWVSHMQVYMRTISTAKLSLEVHSTVPSSAASPERRVSFAVDVAPDAGYLVRTDPPPMSTRGVEFAAELPVSSCRMSDPRAAAEYARTGRMQHVSRGCVSNVRNGALIGGTIRDFSPSFNVFYNTNEQPVTVNVTFMLSDNHFVSDAWQSTNGCWNTPHCQNYAPCSDGDRGCFMGTYDDTEVFIVSTPKHLDVPFVVVEWTAIPEVLKMMGVVSAAGVATALLVAIAGCCLARCVLARQRRRGTAGAPARGNGYARFDDTAGAPPAYIDVVSGTTPMPSS